MSLGRVPTFRPCIVHLHDNIGRIVPLGYYSESLKDAIEVADGFKDRYKCVLEKTETGKHGFAWKNPALAEVRGLKWL